MVDVGDDRDVAQIVTNRHVELSVDSGQLVESSGRESVLPHAAGVDVSDLTRGEAPVADRRIVSHHSSVLLRVYDVKSS